MAVESTTQKLPVVAHYGGGALIGYIDPKANMVTQLGTIQEVSGNVLRIGTGSSEPRIYEYIYNCPITTGAVFYGFSWPTGDGSILLGSGTWPYNVNQTVNVSSGVHFNGSQAIFFSF